MKAGIMTEAERGVPLPCLCPMSAETRERYQG